MTGPDVLFPCLDKRGISLETSGHLALNEQGPSLALYCANENRSETPRLVLAVGNELEINGLVTIRS